MVESDLVGGECAYWGCMPTKTFIRSAETLAEARRARRLAASSIEIKVDFPKAAARTAWMTRDQTVQFRNDIYAQDEQLLEATAEEAAFFNKAAEHPLNAHLVQ